MVAVSDFSGLTSSICALARAAAMAPIDSLERCICGLHFEQIEADGSGLRALGADAMSNRLLGIVRHKNFQFGFGVLMLQKCRSGLAEEPSKLCPGIRRTHVDHSNGRDAGPRWLRKEQTRQLATLHAAPELFLGGKQEVLV